MPIFLTMVLPQQKVDKDYMRNDRMLRLGQYLYMWLANASLVSVWLMLVLVRAGSSYASTSLLYSFKCNLLSATPVHHLSIGVEAAAILSVTFLAGSVTGWQFRSRKLRKLINEKAILESRMQDGRGSIKDEVKAGIQEAFRAPYVCGQFAEQSLEVALSSRLGTHMFEKAVRLGQGAGSAELDFVLKIPVQSSKRHVHVIVECKNSEKMMADVRELSAMAERRNFLRQNVQKIAAKKYVDKYKDFLEQRAVDSGEGVADVFEVVLMYAPYDDAMSAADSKVLDEFSDKKVFLTTPSSLFFLLDIIKMFWRVRTDTESQLDNLIQTVGDLSGSVDTLNKANKDSIDILNTMKKKLNAIKLTDRFPLTHPNER